MSDKLSKRGREIFNLLATGKKNREIAAKLDISNRTVETHRARILKKLLINSNAEILKLYILEKLIEKFGKDTKLKMNRIISFINQI